MYPLTDANNTHATNDPIRDILEPFIRMPYGLVRIYFILFYFLFFLFFRHQGFRMITFDRQAGPLQNFNRSHVMVI